MLSLGIHSAPGSSAKQINSWPKEREKNGDCVCVEWSMAEFSLGLKASKGASGTTPKIKRYWLKSETVTFH